MTRRPWTPKPPYHNVSDDPESSLTLISLRNVLEDGNNASHPRALRREERLHHRGLRLPREGARREAAQVVSGPRGRVRAAQAEEGEDSGGEAQGDYWSSGEHLFGRLLFLLA